MSIQCLKKKGVINYGSKRSGIKPGGVWLNQGPFGKGEVVGAGGPVGFSLNGGTRNVGYIGKSSAMSKNGTPFYGAFARGNGGTLGKYNQSDTVFNLPVSRTITQGQQFGYIKPSVLSNKGMLEKKYKWINNGQYPNYWVQPVYPDGTQSDSASQQVYIDTKAAANTRINDTNRPDLYVDYHIRGGPFLCHRTPAKFKSFAIISNKGYTKTLGIPIDSSQYTLQIQRKCAQPTGMLKPFPFATNGGTGNGAKYYQPPAVQQINYLEPPEWYWNNKKDNCELSNLTL
jgi:hypothetical protein